MATTNPTTAIVDKVEVTPALPNTPATTATLRADITREYGVGGQRNWFFGYAQALSSVHDDIQRDWGAAYYEDVMAHDPVISSCLNMLVDAVFENGITLLPAVGKDHPKYNRAVKVRDRCQRAVEGMSKPLVQSLRSMAYSYLVGGYKIAEVVCRQQSKPKQYSLTLDRIKPKHREVVAPVVDAYSNVIGFYMLEVGMWRMMGMGQYLTAAQVAELLPRDKCALITFREKDSDPRGQSILRAVAQPYCDKQHLLQQRRRYTSIVGTPSAIGTSAENEQDAYDIGPDNQPKKDANGDFIMISPQSSMAKTLERLQSGTYAALPFGAKIELLEALTGGEAVFDSGLSYCDAQIIRGILFQTLATTEGEHNARAASDNHDNIGGLLFTEIKEDFQRVGREDVFKPLVRRNEGDDIADELTPFVSLSKTEQHDFAVESKAYADLKNAGLLFPSQYGEAFSDLGLPIPTEEELAAATALALAPPIDPTQNNNDTQGGNTGFAKFADLKDGQHFITVNGHAILIDDNKEKSKEEKGGGVASSGSKPAKQTLTKEARSAIAKQSAKLTGGDIQRYAENVNEPMLAKTLGGTSMPDNEPIDVEVRDESGKVVHGVELKTMVDNDRGQIHMKAYAIARKQAWVQENNAPFHTVVFDDHAVFNKNGQGNHGDTADRIMYYKRGFGSYRISSMYKVKDEADLKRVMALADRELPREAQPLKNYTSPSSPKSSET